MLKKIENYGWGLAILTLYFYFVNRLTEDQLGYITLTTIGVSTMIGFVDMLVKNYHAKISNRLIDMQLYNNAIWLQNVDDDVPPVEWQNKIGGGPQQPVYGVVDSCKNGWVLIYHGNKSLSNKIYVNYRNPIAIKKDDFINQYRYINNQPQIENNYQK